MAGLLTHVLISLFGGVVIWFFSRWYFGALFGLGQLLPDFIDFGITSVFAGSLKPSVIIFHNLFYSLKIIGHSFSNWIVASAVLILIAVILFKFGKISRDKFVGILGAVFFLLVGVGAHIVADIFILESNHWI